MLSIVKEVLQIKEQHKKDMVTEDTKRVKESISQMKSRIEKLVAQMQMTETPKISSAENDEKNLLDLISVLNMATQQTGVKCRH